MSDHKFTQAQRNRAHMMFLEAKGVSEASSDIMNFARSIVEAECEAKPQRLSELALVHDLEEHKAEIESKEETIRKLKNELTDRLKQLEFIKLDNAQRNGFVGTLPNLRSTYPTLFVEIDKGYSLMEKIQ